MIYFEAARAPMALHGLIVEDGFRRMPRSVAEAVSDGVSGLHGNTAGGRVRFVTDSKRIEIRCSMPAITRFSHMPLTGSSGFDLYRDGVFIKVFEPPYDMTEGYACIHELGDGKAHRYEINFPLYNDVTALEIGLEPKSLVMEAPAYAIQKPVVFYGSSITQGACASRPGMSYPNILSRRLDADIINLGFSGSGKGEESMARYIADLDMTAFVLDYDHNAPDEAYLESTHAQFVRIVREKHPLLPVILISKPDFRFERDQYTISHNAARREIIRSTYQQCRENGDTNVCFIDGETLWDGLGWDGCTVDGCHPNDMGMWRMSRMIGDLLEKILQRREE